MPVAGVGKYEVVSGGVGKNESGEKPGPRPLLAQSAHQAPERQHRRGEEQRGTEVPEGMAAGGFGNAVPVIEETLQADDGELPRIRSDPIERQALAIRGVSQFSHALKFFELRLIQVALQVGHQHAVRSPPIAQTQLQTEVVTQEDEASENLVIADQPGRENREENKRRQEDPCNRREPAAAAAPPDPQPAERQKSQHRGISQSRHTPQRAKERPAPPPGPIFQFKGGEEDQTEQQWSKGCIPYPVDGPVPLIGKQAPDPGRPEGDALDRKSVV